MPIDDRTTNRSYKLPNAGNFLADDVQRLRDALTSIDSDVFARYTKTEVNQLIADLIDGAPGALDSLNGLAAAIGNNPNFAVTINAALAALGSVDQGIQQDVSDLQATVTALTASTPVEHVFTSNGTQTAFTLSTAATSAASLMVSVDGVVQQQADYTLSPNGLTLTLSEAPPNGSILRIYALGASGAQVVSQVAITGGITLPAGSTAGVAVTPANTSYLSNGTDLRGILGQVIGTLARASGGSYTFAPTVAPTTSTTIPANTMFVAGGLSANIQPGFYVNESTGRADVADGQTFRVQGNNDIAAIEYRRVNATTSTLIALYSAPSAAQSVRDDLQTAGIYDYTGSGPTYPIVTDENQNVVLGYNTTDQTIVGAGIVPRKDIPDYTGSGPLYPIVTDAVGNIILGYNSATQKVVGVDAQIYQRLEEQPLSDKPIPAAINHLISYGQSLSIGVKTGTVISTTQPYSNVTFSGGPRANNGTTYVYSPLKPLVEDNNSFPADGGLFGETVCSGAANFALSLAASQNSISPSSHVILASAAGKGSYSIAELKKGSTWYNDRFLPHVNQGKYLAGNYAVHAFCWLQGEQNQTLQTSFNTYRSELAQLQQDIETDVKAITSQTSGVYCITYQLASRLTGTFNGNNGAVPLAQLSLAQTNPKFALAAPCYHLPRSDGEHFTSVGSKWMGAYIGRCYKKIVFDGVKPPFLNPVSATRRGAVIRVRFHVPVAPLVFDTITLASTTDYGFRVLDGEFPVTISSIAIDKNDVVITLASVPTSTVKVRYALDYLGAGITIDSGASGNLRDSDPETIVISGINCPLYNVCPHFELTAITLGE